MEMTNDLTRRGFLTVAGSAAAVGTVGQAATAQAKEICAECPVQEACLQYALATNQSAGVWGGLDEGDRRRLRRRIRDRDRRKAS